MNINIVLFSQARSGSTFVTENLPKLMGFSQNQIFHEGYFLNRHFTYLQHFAKKHNNFFLNVNEFVYQRTNLIKKKTLYIYLYRHSDEIQKSYNNFDEIVIYHFILVNISLKICYSIVLCYMNLPKILNFVQNSRYAVLTDDFVTAPRISSQMSAGNLNNFGYSGSSASASASAANALYE